MKSREGGYVLPLAIGIAFFTMIVVLIVFSAVKANWWAYWDMRLRFESQLMAEDIIAVVSAEESYEWADGDSDYSYLMDVWEDPNMTHVMKYRGGGSYDFLTYYPMPDTYPAGFQPRPITGAFYLNSDAVDDINHEVTLIALVSGKGVDADDLFATLQDAALWGDVGSDTAQYASRRAYYSFTLGIKYLENVSMADYNSLDFGKFARIGGEAYLRSYHSSLGLYPISTVGGKWELYSGGSSLQASAQEGYPYPDRLFDTVFLGKLHLYDNTLKIYQGKDGKVADLYQIPDNLYTLMDTDHEAAAISLRVKVCDEGDTEPCETWAKNSGLPWYKWCWNGYGDTCYSWQYRLVHPSLVTPPGSNVESGLSNRIFPFGYSLGDTGVLDQLFGPSSYWIGMVRTEYNSPVQRATRDGNYLDIRSVADSRDVVATLFTTCADASCTELHTKLAVVAGKCERKQGCYTEAGAQVHVYDLQNASSSGETILVDFGDNSEIYLTPPCVPRYGSDPPVPFWNNLPLYGGGHFSLCYYASFYGRRVFYVSDDGSFSYSNCHINPRACDPAYNPNTDYPWTHRIYMDQDDLDYIASKNNWTGYAVSPKVWHMNWQNAIQYNMNITIVGGSMAVLGDVVPVPSDTEQPSIYEYDLAEDPSHMQLGVDLPNMVDFPDGHVLGILLSGFPKFHRMEDIYNCVWWHGSWRCSYYGHTDIQFSLWFMDYSTDPDYAVGETALGGFRFLPDPDNLLPGNTENKEWHVGWAHDMLFYAHVFIRNSGWGYYPAGGPYEVDYYYKGGELVDVELEEDGRPPFSEVFRKLGMFGSYSEGTGMLGHYGGSCYGFCRDRYYLAPKNPVKSRPYYWVMPDPNHMPDVYITDLRMHK